MPRGDAGGGGYAGPDPMAAPDALQQPMELDLFEGPFDLLLTLVLRDEVDLLELPLLEVVTGALGERARERWDTETAGELIVLLAAMAELKARRLLGEPVDEEPDPDALEARERLAARLIAYAPFPRAAVWLADRSRATPPARATGGCRSRARRRRPCPREAPGSLRDAMRALLAAPPAPSLAHLTSRRVSLPEAIARLQAALARARSVSFDALTAGAGRLEEAITLMATLELARRGEVTLAQAEPFGDIAIVGSAAVTGLARSVEALLFLSPEPLSLVALCELTEEPPGPVQRALAELGERHGPEGGLEVAEVAGGFALRTRADLAEVCDRLRERPPEDRITPAGLETLAVVAYLEPISRPQISRLRGVAADSTVASLVERGLLEEAGRPAEGGAMRYRTTRLFQERFDLRGPATCRRSSASSSAGPRPSGCGAQLVEAGHLRARRRGRRWRVSGCACTGPSRSPGSRAAARPRALVAEGRVSVNGEPATVGQLVGPGRPPGGRRPAGPRPRARCAPTCSTSRRRRLDGARPPGAADRPRRPAARRARLPGRTARHRHDRGAAGHQRRRAGGAPDAPVLEGAQDLRGAAAGPGVGGDGPPPAPRRRAGGRA